MSSRGRLVVAALALLLAGLGVAVAVWWPRGPVAGGGDADGGAGEAGAGGAEATAPAAVLTRIRGKVLLEEPGPTGQGPGDRRPGTGARAEGGDEQDEDGSEGPGGAEVEDEGGEAARPGEELVLAPPPIGTCVARVWRAAKLLAEDGCGVDGGFLLALPPIAVATPGTQAEVVVEMLVPGRLRGVLVAPVIEGVDVELPTVALGPASQLHGQVLNRKGEPIAGVEVAALPVPHLGEPEPWRVTSGADGGFVLDTIPEGPMRLRATHPGHALTIRDAYAPEAGVVIVLDELLALGGAVIGEPGLVGRARVRLEGSSLWPPLVEQAGADGSFVFPELIDGVYGLVATVEAETPGAQEYASIPLENLGPGVEVGLALALAYRIPVKVVSPDGEAVPGARVTVGYASVGLLQQVGETGPDGQVAIGPTVPGPYVVRADADGYLPSETLTVDLGATPLSVQTLTLVRPGRISGTVVDEEGHVVAEANITVDGEGAVYSPGEGVSRAGTFTALVRGGSLGVTRGAVPPIPLFAAMEGEEALGLAAQSDDGGHFTLDLLMPGTYRLRAMHGLHAASAVATVRLAPGESADGVVLVLGRGVHLTGRVFDGNRRPLAGVRVELEDGSEVLTDAFGVFDAGYRRGRERLVLRGAGLVPEVVEVDLGRQDLEIERLMQPAEGEVHGRVRDGNDRPIEGVRVTLTPNDGLTPTTAVWTDARGLFALTDLAPGGAVLEVEHPDYAPASRPLRVARRGAGAAVELRMLEGWDLSLSVVARGSGEPIAGARVEVEEQLWATDAEGDATVRRLAGERVRVVVRAGGWVGQSQTVERPDDGQAMLVFELDEAAGMEGEVTDERGEPVGGARVVVRSRDGQVLADTRTAADGRWSAPDLPEGDVVVEAVPPAALAAILAPVTVESDVRRGHVTREVDLRFDRL